MSAHQPAPDPTRPVPDQPDQFERHGLDAEGLLTTFGDLPPATVAGLEPTPEALLLHLVPIEDDPRGTLAGLFEIVVPQSWQAVALCVEGRADAPDDDQDADVDIRVLLTRSGELCTRIDSVGGGEQVPATTTHPSKAAAGDAESQGVPSGLLVDCLHRLMGLATPGSPPDPVDIALGIWAQAMLERLFDHGDLSWTDAVELHPGQPGGTSAPSGSVSPSIETLVEATFRSTDDWDWARVHRRARHGSVRARSTPGEAAWMDTAMYGRWVMSHLADPLGVADLLDSHDFGAVAAGLRAVVDGVDEWRHGATAA